jgi:hypothetical protein
MKILDSERRTFFWHSAWGTEGKKISILLDGRPLYKTQQGGLGIKYVYWRDKHLSFA